MAQRESSDTFCDVPEWFGFPENSTASYINDALVAAVNVMFSVFAVLCNLAITVTIIKTPSLQRPCNILLCSLAASDCLTSLTAQPMFVTLRLIIHHGNSSCNIQDDLFTAFYASIMLTSGCSFAFITVISFDRHYALSRPMVYRASVTNKGNAKLSKLLWPLKGLLEAVPPFFLFSFLHPLISFLSSFLSSFLPCLRPPLQKLSPLYRTCLLWLVNKCRINRSAGNMIRP